MSEQSEGDALVDQMLQAVDMDCSLSSADFMINDLGFTCSSFKVDKASPSTSSNDSSSLIHFDGLLHGISEFLNSPQLENDLEQCRKTPPCTNDIESNIVKSVNNSTIIAKKKKIKKGQRYKPLFKEKVLKYAAKHTFRETADKFNINCNTLTEWAREYKRLLQLKKSTTSRPGSTLKTDVSCNLANTDETDALKERLQVSADVKFMQWLRRQRLDGVRVRREDMQSTGLAFLSTGAENEDWFTRWIKRLNEKSITSKSSKADKPIFYPNSFKLEVALFAKKYTKKAAATTFCVSSRRLYEWCEREEDIASPEPNVLTGAGLARRHVETQLRQWFNKKCADGAQPKSREVALEARSLYAASGLPHVKCSRGWLESIRKRLNLKLSHSNDDTLLMWLLSQLDDNRSLSLQQVTTKAQQLAVQNRVTSFKGSKGWTLRFLKRHSHLLQCSSVRLNDLPQVAVSLSQGFCRTIQQRVNAAGLPAQSLGCMDEIPINFVYPTEKVRTPRLLRQVGLETAHAVVLLAATSDGCLLPPTVVLKGKRMTETFLVGEVSLLVLHQPEGNVDAQTLRDWVQLIWLRYVMAPSVLVVDSFAPHKDEDVTEELAAGCCQLGVIPPGCAVHLHPCAFNLARRFQEAIQEEWLLYVSESRCQDWRSKGTPNEEEILKWVVKAYLILREDTYSIRSSFQLAGLTNGVELKTVPDLYISKTDPQV